MTCVLGGVPGSPLAAQALRYEGNVGLSNGTYTLATPTTSWAWSNGLALEFGRVSIRAIVPAYLQTPVHVETGVDASTPADRDTEVPSAYRDSASGQGRPAAMLSASATPAEARAVQPLDRRIYLGDPVGQIAVNLVPAAGTALGIRVTAKMPVTDSVNFGTGRWDVGFGVTASQRLTGTTFASVDVSYWQMGEPSGLALQNPLVVSGSCSGLLGRRWGWVLSGTAGQSSIEGFPAFYSVGGGVVVLGRVWTINVNAMVGLSETAADFAVGVGWSFRLLGR